MTIVETVLIYVGGPAVVLGGLALLTVLPGAGRKPRYRAGQDWDFAPVWWSANPDGVGAGHPAADAPATDDVVGGGARGTW